MNEIGRLLTAMVTPFKADGSVDYAAAEKLAHMLIADGSSLEMWNLPTGKRLDMSLPKEGDNIDLLALSGDGRLKAVPGRTP